MTTAAAAAFETAVPLLAAAAAVVAMVLRVGAAHVAKAQHSRLAMEEVTTSL